MKIINLSKNCWKLTVFENLNKKIENKWVSNFKIKGFRNSWFSKICNQKYFFRKCTTIGFRKSILIGFRSSKFINFSRKQNLSIFQKFQNKSICDTIFEHPRIKNFSHTIKSQDRVSFEINMSILNLKKLNLCWYSMNEMTEISSLHWKTENKITKFIFISVHDRGFYFCVLEIKWWRHIQRCWQSDEKKSRVDFKNKFQIFRKKRSFSCDRILLDWNGSRTKCRS